MRGQRLYTISGLLLNGEKKEINYWSSNKKGSIENFIDGFDALKREYKLETSDFVAGSFEVSYAQTSLSRR